MRKNKSNLIGLKVDITDKDSVYYKEWGIIKDYDGEYYYIAIANGDDSLPIFDRGQIKIYY